MGHLYLRIGPMKSGKTEFLIKTLKNFHSAGHPCLYINSNKDTREKVDSVSTHTGPFAGFPKGLTHMTVERLADIDIRPYKYIGIDEGQFYGEEIVDTVTFWIDNYDVEIYCSALDGNIKREPMGFVGRLIPLAKSVEKVCSMCDICLKEMKIVEAPYTVYKDPGRQLVGSIDPGGAEKYLAVCGKHRQL